MGRTKTPAMPPPAVPLAAGDVVGNYIIRAPLGEGGMGAVYDAQHPHLDRRAVVKVLHAALAADPVAVDRFAKEAKALAALSHRNIVNVYDSGQRPDGQWYLAMEYVEGTSLERWLTFRGGVLNADEVVGIIGQAANGLHAAHEKGIVHRDVKPANILVSDDGHVRVIDFGIAKMREPGRAARTAARTILGTPAYMAPEQIRGDDIDRRIDVYALGVVAWELLAGQALWGDGMPAWILEQQLRQARPVDPCAINAKIPPTIGAAVARALSFDRGDRYETTAEFAVTLGHGLPSEWGDTGIQILRHLAPELFTVGPAISTAGREVVPRHVAAPTLRVHAPEPPQASISSLPQAQAVRGDVPTAPMVAGPGAIPVAGPTTPPSMVGPDGATASERSDAPDSIAARAVSMAPTGVGDARPNKRGRIAVVAAVTAAVAGVAITVLVMSASGSQTTAKTGAAGQLPPSAAVAPADPVAPAAPVTATLAIVTEPPGGLVFVDGIGRGPAPVNIAASVGADLDIRAELVGHATASQRVRLAAAPATVRLVMTAISAPLAGPPDVHDHPTNRPTRHRPTKPGVGAHGGAAPPFDPTNPVK